MEFVQAGRANPGVLLEPHQIYPKRSDDSVPFSCQDPQEVTFKEAMTRHSWRNFQPYTLTISFVSLTNARRSFSSVLRSALAMVLACDFGCLRELPATVTTPRVSF